MSIVPLHILIDFSGACKRSYEQHGKGFLAPALQAMDRETLDLMLKDSEEGIAALGSFSMLATLMHGDDWDNSTGERKNDIDALSDDFSEMTAAIGKMILEEIDRREQTNVSQFGAVRIN
jgi:hypothetical protein